MDDKNTLGPYLRRERERRGLTLRTISESTKVSMALLEGLEADDVSRWPGGIFRRAFVRSYAQCVGLDADEVVRRFEQQHQPPEPEFALPRSVNPQGSASAGLSREDGSRLPPAASAGASKRARVQGTIADLMVALVLGFASAAAGSRLLWPVVLIAAYYSIGILLTGTSPMVALLGDHSSPAPAPQRPADEQPGEPPASAARPAAERRRSRRLERARHRRDLHARAN
ncbi:MAG TPA: helix-turn-helix domain-containing protein [Vicinamibacterales bacterium]|nr:helix-turn-helix domain-containing protein [Vicinamibacterales bacterium]